MLKQEHLYEYTSLVMNLCKCMNINILVVTNPFSKHEHLQWFYGYEGTLCKKFEKLSRIFVKHEHLYGDEDTACFCFSGWGGTGWPRQGAGPPQEDADDVRTIPDTESKSAELTGSDQEVRQICGTEVRLPYVAVPGLMTISGSRQTDKTRDQESSRGQKPLDNTWRPTGRSLYWDWMECRERGTI